jgi:hypothetical protein
MCIRVQEAWLRWLEVLGYCSAVAVVTAVQVLRGDPFNETSDLYRCACTLLLQLMMMRW